jgi:hypothetical protein
VGALIMQAISHDPRLLTAAFFLALIVLIALVLLFVWLRSRWPSFDPASVPCGMYGICQSRLDCADGLCEGHPKNKPKSKRPAERCAHTAAPESNVVRLHRRSGGG